MIDARRYQPQLDGLRAVAVLVVMLGHSWERWLPGGGVGVDLFFALSGYLITSLLIAEMQNRGAIDLPRFYGRRAVRLFPALLLMLAVVLLWARPPLFDVAAALFYFGNWVRALGVSSLGSLGPTWSLSVEEQFYLVWPLVLIGSWRLARLRGVLVAALLGSALAWVLRGLLWASPDRVYNGTDTRMDGLLLGAGLAVVLATERGTSIARRLVVWLVLPAAAVVALEALSREPSWWRYLGVSASSAVIVAALLLYPASWAARLLTLRPLVYVGKISYGMYLWHYPVQFALVAWIPYWLRFPVVLLTTLAIASASFFAVERPISRRLRPLVTTSWVPKPTAR